MDVVFRLQGIEFEWDADKAESNVRKHGVTFEEAAEAFFDPFYQTGDASVEQESRDFIIGYTFSQHLLLVVYVERVRQRVLKGNFMKRTKETERKPDEEFELRLRPRPTTAVTLQVPDDVLASLERVASGRDMSVEALMKLYIGQGLRQDLSRILADRVLEKTAQVLTRHLQSEEEISAILQEIRIESAA